MTVRASLSMWVLIIFAAVAIGCAITDLAIWLQNRSK